VARFPATSGLRRRRSLVLALGIGVNTAVFSIVRPILLRPLRSRRGGARLISPLREDGRGVGSYTGAAFDEIERRTRSFSQLSAYYAGFQFAPFTLMGQGEAEALTGTMVTPDFFDTLGAQVAGRVFSSAEAPPFGFASTAVVISHGLWQRRFGGDPGLIGRSLNFSFGPAIVVGILPASFDFGSVFAPGIAVDLFLPLPAVVPGVWGAPLAIVGRLNPGVSPDTAQAEVDALLPQLRRDHPDWGEITALVTELNTQVNGRFRRSIGSYGDRSGWFLIAARTCPISYSPPRRATGVRDSHRARGEPRKDRPPAAHRRDLAGDCGRRGGSADRLRARRCRKVEYHAGDPAAREDGRRRRRDALRRVSCHHGRTCVDGVSRAQNLEATGRICPRATRRGDRVACRGDDPLVARDLRSGADLCAARGSRPAGA
jgi:hypothetical protein